MNYVKGFAQLGQVLWRSRKLPLVKVPHSATVDHIYHRQPPVWARWALVLVAVDVMAVTSIVEYTWGIGERVQSMVTGAPQEEPAENPSEPLPVKTMKSVKTQPVWKKTVFSGVYVFIGACMAVAILGNRARVIRTINYTKKDRNTNTPSLIFLQAASHPTGYGIAFPARDCSLRRFSSPNTPTQMIVRVADHGGWLLDLNGATINGKKEQTLEAYRTALQYAWRKAGGKVPPRK